MKDVQFGCILLYMKYAEYCLPLVSFNFTDGNEKDYPITY